MSVTKKTLGELCIIEKGKVGIQKAIPGEYPLVVTAEERLSHDEYHFEGNAVVIPLVSSTGHGHKSLKRIHFQSGKFAVGNILCAVMPKDETVLNAEYLYRFLDLNREKELVGRMKGMANVSLPLKEIALIEIPLPPLAEQLKFVEEYKHLETVKNKLDTELTHQLSFVKQLRQSFLREAMQGRLTTEFRSTNPELIEGENSAQALLKRIEMNRNGSLGHSTKKGKELAQISEDEIPFEIPEGWVWCRLGEIIKISSGDGLTSSKMNLSGNIPVYGGNGINGYHDQYNTDEETIVIGRVGYYCGCIHMTMKKAWVTDNAFIVEFPVENFCRYFLVYMLKWSNLGKQQFAGSQPVISGPRIYPTIIPLPPLSEQQAIVTKLDELMRYCDELEASIRTSQQQNEMLLQQVLREALEG